MKQKGRWGCGCNELTTDDLVYASEWLSKQIGGQNHITVKIVVHGDGCMNDPAKRHDEGADLPIKLVPLGTWNQDDEDIPDR